MLMGRRPKGSSRWDTDTVLRGLGPPANPTPSLVTGWIEWAWWPELHAKRSVCPATYIAPSVTYEH